MSRIIRSIRSAALALGCAAIVVPQVNAQSAEGLDEIIVTARRAAESLQEVPGAVTAISAEAIEAAGVDDLRDVARLTPGLRFDDLVAGLFATPTIRGLAISNILSEPNVGTFLDGVYISAKSGVDLNLVDVERIEVIKGPQSALYGRNTFAGAINYVSRDPGTELNGRVRVTGGNDGLRTIRGTVGGALGSPSLRGSVGAYYGEYDGGYTEAVSGDSLGGYEKKALTASLVWDATEQISVRANLYYGDDTLQPIVIGRLPNNCAPTTPTSGVFRDFCGEVPDLEDVSVEASTRNPLLRANDREVVLASLGLRWSFSGGYELSALAGYNDVESVSYGDFDRTQNGAPFALTGGGTALANYWIGEDNGAFDSSFELRLNSPRERSMRWSIGGYRYRSFSDRGVPVAIDLSQVPSGVTIASPFAFLGTATGRTVPFYSFDTAEVRQTSGFASFEADVASTVTLTAEGRYTTEDKRVNALRNAFALGADTDGPGLSEEFDYSDYRFTARWQPVETINVYASVAKGTKAGGFNAGALNPDERSYDPESNRTYEIGVKTEWMDRRVRLNTAVYFIDWQDVQLTVPQNSSSPAAIIRNFGEVEAKGIEVELTARIASGLDLGVGFAYGSPEFTGADSITTQDAALCAAIAGCRTETRAFPIVPTPAPPAASTVNRLVALLDGNQLPRAYKEQAFVNLQYERTINDNWTGFGRVDYSYQSREYDRAINTSWIPARSITDLRVGARSESWTVTLFAENLFDVTAATAGTRQTALNTGATFLDIVGGLRRRSVGLTVGYDF